MPSKIKGKADFVEKHTGWLIKAAQDPDLAASVRQTPTLDGIYNGKSHRIHRMIRLAYLRGVQRGAGMVWDGQQKLSLRQAT